MRLSRVHDPYRGLLWREHGYDVRQRSGSRPAFPSNQRCPTSAPGDAAHYEHRLVYLVTDKEVIIIAARYHY